MKVEKYSVSLTKDEFIRLCADRMVTEGICDCSEFYSTQYAEEQEEYEFIKENIDEILFFIKHDERVADVEYYKGDMSIDMVFFTDYCVGFYEDNDFSNKEKHSNLQSFKDFIIGIRNGNPPRALNTNTRELINDFCRSKFNPNEDNEMITYYLKETLLELRFVEKYLKGYEVYVNSGNIDELISCLETRVIELERDMQEKNKDEINIED